MHYVYGSLFHWYGHVSLLYLKHLKQVFFFNVVNIFLTLSLLHYYYNFNDKNNYLTAKKNPEMVPFGLFDIAVVGGPCCLVGILYMAIFSRCLLPKGNSNENGDGNGENGENGEEGKSNAVDVGVATTIQERNRMPRSYMVYFVVPGSSGSPRSSAGMSSASDSLTPVDYGLETLEMSINGIFLEGVLRDQDTFDGVGEHFRAPTSERTLYRPETGNWEDVR